MTRKFIKKNFATKIDVYEDNPLNVMNEVLSEIRKEFEGDPWEETLDFKLVKKVIGENVFVSLVMIIPVGSKLEVEILEIKFNGAKLFPVTYQSINSNLSRTAPNKKDLESLLESTFSSEEFEEAVSKASSYLA